jgi:hypothetical protein
MTPLQLALVLGAATLFVAGWLRMRQRAAPPVREAAGADGERLDTLMGWPPQATKVLSGQERVAYAALQRALPECIVLAQVPMARFLNVPKRNSYADWLRRIGYQCVDFAVCDKAAQVIAVVELQKDAQQPPTARARKRLARMTRSLEAARIPLLNWRADTLPSPSGIRDAIMPRATATPFAHPGAAAQPIDGPPLHGGFNPFDDPHRDSTQDEVIEVLEPPPSTWFDELDSAPMPLADEPLRGAPRGAAPGLRPATPARTRAR